MIHSVWVGVGQEVFPACDLTVWEFVSDILSSPAMGGLLYDLELLQNTGECPLCL